MSDLLEPGRTRVGWIGTGVMGAAMCGHVLAKGYAVTVHSRTRAKASELVARGAVWTETPRRRRRELGGRPHDGRLPRGRAGGGSGPKGRTPGATPGRARRDITTSDPVARG